MSAPVRLERCFTPAALLAAFQLHSARVHGAALDDVSLAAGFGTGTSGTELPPNLRGLGATLHLQGLDLAGGLLQDGLLQHVVQETPATVRAPSVYLAWLPADAINNPSGPLSGNSAVQVPVYDVESRL